MSVDKREMQVVVTQRQIKQVVSAGTQGPKGANYTREQLDSFYDPLGAADDAEAAAAADATAKDAAHVAELNPHPQYATDSALSDHTGNTSNPHSVTKAQVGLGNVDNTSDANKPVSTAQQAALNGKEATIAAGTTSQYWRGDKSWRDFATDVRASVLTGLSTASATVVAAADSVLVSIGKLQAQISDIVTQADAEAGTSTTRKSWTALRVRQAIAAWWLTASSALGRTLANIADAAAGRTALGLGSASTLTAGQADANLPTNTDIRAYYGAKFKAPIRPTLRIDFENGVFERYVASTNTWKRFDNWSAFAADLGADLTVTRAGEQTYFDALGKMRVAAANTVECDHDPITGVPLGPYIGGARTNLAIRSNNLADAVAWSQDVDATMTANSWIGVDGTVSFTKCTLPGVGPVTHYQTITGLSPSTTYTFSWYFDKGTVNEDPRYAVYDAVAAVWTVPETSYAAVTGLRRYSITFTTGASQTSCRIYPCRFLTTAVGECGVGGVQLEAGANPSPLIPTTVAAVTRPITVGFIGGTPFTDFYNQSEGTFRVAVRPGTEATGIRGYMTASDGTTLTSAGIREQSGSARGLYNSAASGLSVTLNLSGSPVLHARTVVASGYALADFVASKDGGALGTNTSAQALPICNQMHIGQTATGATLNGWLGSAEYFPHKLANASHQEMSK